MDYGESENAGNMQVPTVELDEQFIADLETDEVILERGEGMNVEKCSFQYVTNALELLNERYDELRYDPNMDIVKNQYEGGFKLWEGTYDLINLIYNNMQDIDLNGKKVLDLGCGSGLIGIFCLKAFDLKSITFQDYNLDVLKFSTLANVIKNGLEEQIPKCKFISGDWSLTPEKVVNNTNEIVTKLHGEAGEASKFDAILMSEVLYNSDQYQKIGYIINELLNPDGVCIISSKLYYFGCNGSVDEFKDFMQANFPHLNVQTLQEISNKKSNKREIFSVKHPAASA